MNQKKVNPYAVAVKTANVIGVTIGVALVLLVVCGIGFVAFSTWGWWAVLMLPLILACIVGSYALVLVLMWFFMEVVLEWVGRKRREWDERNR